MLAFLLVSCKIEGKLTILLEGMTVELEVIPSSTENKISHSTNSGNFYQISPLIENLLLVPRTGTGVKPPIFRLDSTNSSSNFLRFIERVELVFNKNVKSVLTGKFLYWQTFAVDAAHSDLKVRPFLLEFPLLTQYLLLNSVWESVFA